MTTPRTLLSATLIATLSLLVSNPVHAQQAVALPDPAPADVDVPPPPAIQADVSEIEFGAIVRVEVDVLGPNYQVPWNIGGTGSGNGTGFLVGPNRFMTNAHVVSNARLIYIKKYDDPKPYLARVLHVAHDCDLAMLEVEDSSAFANIKPLEIGEIPKLNTTVIAVGYPIGGERISVTRGVVSRIDFRSYSHSGVDQHLAIQVDAAINPGNSGGPVLQNNKVVGVAFQGYSGSVAQNTGYMIPSPVINRFLTDIEDGHYDHYVDMAVSNFNILNPAQRVALGLKNDGRGVMVSVVDSASCAYGVLETEDVLLAIDGYDIASDGFVTIKGERINLNEIVERKFAGDTVQLDVQRAGKPLKLEIELKRFIPYLIQANTYDAKPNFVLFAGLQFQPLDRNLMGAHNIDDMQVRYNYLYFGSDEIYRERPEVVVLTKVLPDAANTHLQSYTEKVIDSINGVKILTLQDVYDALHGDHAEDGRKDFHVSRAVGEGRPLVIERSKAQAAHQRIMAGYNVTSDHFIEPPLIVEEKLVDLDAIRKQAAEKEAAAKKDAAAAPAPAPAPAGKAKANAAAGKPVPSV